MKRLVFVVVVVVTSWKIEIFTFCDLMKKIIIIITINSYSSS